MKLTRGLLALALTFSLSLFSFITLPTRTATAQDARIALQRGYRTGYSDGYMAGYRDSIDNAAKDFAHHQDYTSADRAYNKDYGTIEDYRDGYKQGFEIGYNTGYDKKSFESTIPADLKRRVIETANAPVDVPAEAAKAPVVESNVPAEPVKNETPVEPIKAEPIKAETTQPAPTENTETTTPAPQSTSPENVQNVNYRQGDAVIIIPRDTELIVELVDPLSTEKNKVGDKFTARVLSPNEISGAVIEGRVNRVEKPGRIKKRSEMQLSFDRIVLSEVRWSNFDAILTEVLPVKGDNVKRVDGEGSAVGKSSIKPDATKVAASTGAGAGIGAITGGPVGAAVGAGVGAAFGVGAIVIERGKHVNLNSNQQLRIRTSYETKIR